MHGPFLIGSVLSVASVSHHSGPVAKICHIDTDGAAELVRDSRRRNAYILISMQEYIVADGIASLVRSLDDRESLQYPSAECPLDNPWESSRGSTRAGCATLGTTLQALEKTSPSVLGRVGSHWNSLYVASSII